MSVQGLGGQLANHPFLPKQPRLIVDALAVETANGFLFNVAGLRLIKGKGVAPVLRQLIPLLDGQHDDHAINAALPDYKLAFVRDVLAYLFSEGMIEESWAEDALPHAAARRAAFYSQQGSTARDTPNGAIAEQRVAGSSVALYGRGAIHTALAHALAGMGIGDLHVIEGDLTDTLLLDSVQAGSRRPDLVVVALDVVDSDRLRQVNRRALMQGIRLLPVVATQQGISEIGPLVVPYHTACYGCYQLAHSRCEIARYSPDVDATTASASISFAAQQAALDIIYLLTGVAVPASINAALVGDGAQWQWDTRYVLRLPRCEDCGTQPNGVDLDLSLGPDHAENLMYLMQLSAHRVTETLSRNAPRVGADKRNALLAENSFMSRVNSVPQPLPPAPETLSPTDTLTAEGLAALLYYTLGAQPRTVAGRKVLRRGIATGGSLGSPDLYVAVFTVEGIVPGLYHYNGLRHALEPMHTPPDLRNAVVGAFDGGDPAVSAAATTAAAVIFETGALGRMLVKYDQIAYRITTIDAGVALQSLRHLAARLGFRTVVGLEFYDEDVRELLGAFNEDELPLYALMLTGGDQ